MLGNDETVEDGCGKLFEEQDGGELPSAREGDVDGAEGGKVPERVSERADDDFVESLALNFVKC